jgi:hypothetical protein
MEIQQMMEFLLAKMDGRQEEMPAKMDADREERKQETSTGQEHLKEEMKTQMASLVSWMDLHQAKMHALIVDMKDGRKEKTACQKPTETNPEEMEPNPEMMQSVGEHQEVPKEKAALRSGALKNRHMARNPAAERQQKPKERTRGNCGSRKRWTVAGRKMIRRAGVAWCKTIIFRKTGPGPKLSE